MRPVDHLVDPGGVQVLVEAPERYDELPDHHPEVPQPGVAEVPVLEGDLLASVLVLHLAGREQVADDVAEHDDVEVVVIEEELRIAVASQVRHLCLEVGVPGDHHPLGPQLPCEDERDEGSQSRDSGPSQSDACPHAPPSSG